MNRAFRRAKALKEARPFASLSFSPFWSRAAFKARCAAGNWRGDAFFALAMAAQTRADPTLHGYHLTRARMAALNATTTGVRLP